MLNAASSSLVLTQYYMWLLYFFGLSLAGLTQLFRNSRKRAINAFTVILYTVLQQNRSSYPTEGENMHCGCQ